MVDVLDVERLLPPLGLQSIIFGGRYDTASRDQLGAFLKVVSDAGFSAIEFNPADPATFMELAAPYGIVHAGLHMLLSRTVDPEPIIRTLEVTGARDVCNSGLLKWGGLTAADYYDAIPLLNGIGRAFHREGIRFHYHHHDFEFAVIENNRTGMDLLMDGLDPGVVDFCVDVAWVHRGGLDPAEYLRAHQDRISYLHIKDCSFPKGGSSERSDSTPINGMAERPAANSPSRTKSGGAAEESENWTELGRGVLDFDSIMDAIGTMPNVRWAIVEQDKTAIDPAESCRISRDFLREHYGY